VVGFDEANWELVLAASSGSDDEQAIFNSLRFRATTNPSPGSPYLPTTATFVATSDTSTYRAMWNGRMFSIVVPGTNGTGLDLMKIMGSSVQPAPTGTPVPPRHDAAGLAGTLRRSQGGRHRGRFDARRCDGSPPAFRPPERISQDEALEWFARKFGILPLNPVRANCSTRAESAFRRLAPQPGDPEVERWIPFGTLGPLVLCAHYNPACTQLWDILSSW